MSYTSDVYAALLQTAKEGNQGKSRLARRLKMDNGTVVVFAVDKASRSLELYIQTGKISENHTFPHWKGVEIGVASLPEYGDNAMQYILLKQSEQSEEHIFEIISEDIRLALEELKDSNDVVSCFAAVLTKWKNFFLLEKDIQLSQERELGLLGELLFLRKLLDVCGQVAISYWVGCNEETHDFYVNGNAIEVKTTVQKSPYKATISSEYQLDTQDVSKKLYLQFFALRKSQNDGFTLPETVHIIEGILASSADCLQQFGQKLEKYGYLKACEELYQTCYFLRENSTYLVRSDFPRIEKSELNVGISNVSYAVSIDACQKYLVLDAIHIIIKGENPDAV